ncbi:carboxylesterase/lipase family protein [Nocardia goodfellowii]|uniref:Carboxylic ester hydrolase n=1 Tax=Nocardia goodfellowii TaxID=882446 RepID=A0ABS4QHJ4_9NOCA|nr:carboxylesterase family protein [Nocardia goodfellowii]MBP2191163.1 para-nitrobenzyl esterase [Nocardia goodfellowii]
MDPIVAVTGGRVSGRIVNGVSVFLGIPYAAAPVGAARFAPPAPPAAWDGIRPAVEFGATCMQSPYPPAIAEILGSDHIPGAEYLNVNVWTPDTDARGLPVMVWIHGGAFTRGANSRTAYDGAAFARDGVVLVSVNYRLGVSGFAVLDGAPANRGLRDQIYALEWVRDNIEAFGGDPANVTVFGESAGGISVAALLAAPPARGLFAKAIVQSGTARMAATAADGRLVGAELAAVLGIPATAEAFADVEPAALLAAQETLSAQYLADPDPKRWGPSIVSSGLGITCLFPVLDGEVLTGDVLESVAAGAAANVPLLLGYTAEEFRLFLVPTGIAALVNAEALPVMLTRYGLDPALGEIYAADRPEAAPGDLLAAILTDHAFRAPTMELADAQSATGAPVHVYEFGWRRTDRDLGAMHALEIPFVFDTLAGAAPLTGPGAPQQLADTMHAAWVAFAQSGDPGWEPHNPRTRPVMTFDHPRSALAYAPRAKELAALVDGDPPR